MRAALLALILCTAGCTVTPPEPPAPRTATPVAASAEKTWDAVIDVFAASNIPIRNMDRASGFIAAEEMSVSREDAPVLADCGTIAGMPFRADRATYNVLVRGDSTRSTVKVTVRFVVVMPANGYAAASTKECSSKGIWETERETDIKARAEGRAPQ